ncbi:MAG: hypothetical protein ACQR30_13470 [Arachidicoccus sp.]
MRPLPDNRFPAVHQFLGPKASVCLPDYQSITRIGPYPCAISANPSRPPAGRPLLTPLISSYFFEELSFGGKSRYGNHSLIYLGRGINHVWTYGMNYSFGVTGGCYGLSVYGKQFKSREDALNFALIELKNMMVKKIDSTDTTNDKQPVILATLRDIEKTLVGMVQLSLF